MLTGLKAASGSDPASVGNTVTVSYSLTNVTDEPIQLEFTFVGVRDPADENRDTEDMNEGKLLAPREPSMHRVEDCSTVPAHGNSGPLTS